MKRRLALRLPVLLLARPAAAQAATIEGTALYRERIALAPGAVLTVELLDIARHGAPAEPIASVRIPVEGQVPIRFALPYDPTRITPRGQYALRAVLTRDGVTLFRTDRVHRVTLPTTGMRLELLLRPDSGNAVRPAVSSGLAGPTWVAEDIGGRGVLDRAQSTIVFDARGRVSGRAGCNRFMGSYTVEGASLRLGPLGTTRMACVPEALGDQERRFLAALETVRGWRIERGLLFLTDDAGDAVLRFSHLG